MIQSVALETDAQKQAALKAIGFKTNFYLQYQGRNDLDLQVTYGQFVHRVMAANYPQWATPRPMPPLSPEGKIRVGYLSPSHYKHSVGRLSLGYLTYANRQEFETYCYYIGSRVDQRTQQFRTSCDFFYQIPSDLEAVCRQILADQLHILVFVDIGMFAQMTQMAGLRLAPVQCATWNHPITSGSPMIDYFLSSDLMEPEEAQAHYSETLVRLPNLFTAYTKPSLPSQTLTRTDLGLREDTVLYLSSQSLFKYLPQYDYIFAEIARQVPNAQFAFIA